jgi:hypothetical protein
MKKKITIEELYANEITQNNHWHDLSEHYFLSEEIIREFKNQVNWSVISKHQILSESFIREFQDKVDWGWISKHQVLSESFIEEFAKDVDWYYISGHQKLSYQFIINHLYNYRIDSEVILCNKNISKDIKDSVLNYIKTVYKNNYI